MHVHICKKRGLTPPQTPPPLKFKLGHLQGNTKNLNFPDKFDFEGQGQGHQFQIHLKHLDDQDSSNLNVKF